jgi:hypothetical protein
MGVLLAASAIGVAVAVKPGGHFHANPLKAENEIQTPAVVSDATGVAQFRLSGDGQSLDYRLNVGNIDEVVQAHIHVGAANANGPIVVFLFGPVTPGEGERTNGTLATGTITAANLIGPLAGQPLSALIAEIEAGNTYVNVHTVDYPMGEIRDQVR